MVKIDRRIVSASLIKSRTSGVGNTMKGITIHETSNTNARANADAHARLQLNGNSRDASWHYQVDDKEIIQSFEDNIKCWHAGGVANSSTISIEICVNSDGNYKKAVENAAKLTKHLMNKYNILISNVRQHNYYTEKNCPSNLRSGAKGYSWNDFVNLVKGESVFNPVVPNTNKKSVSVIAKEVIQGKWGNGEDRVNRLSMAGYNYNEVRDEVNKQLGSPIKPSTSKPITPKPSKTVGQMAQEVMKGLHGNGHANRQKSLGVTTSVYNQVKVEVNRLSLEKSAANSKPIKTISQMADEVVKGLHGNGHANRQKSLGVSTSVYNQVKAEVNKKL